MKARTRRTREAAEMLGIQALGFLAREPERLCAFLAATGIDHAAIRDAAKESGFLAGVLGHMLDDENLLIAFADDAGIDPTEIRRAHDVLAGRRNPDRP